MDELRSDRIPSDDEEYGRDGSIRDCFTDRGHDGVVGDVDAVRSLIAHAGHVAAFHGAVQKRLLAGVFAVGQLLFAVAEAEGEAKLVGVDLFMGERGLVAERSQRPALCGFNAHGIDLDSAERVVDDLRVGRSRNCSIRANSDGQNGGHGHGHLSGCGVAADAAVRGAGQGNRRSARAARSVNGIGSRSGNGEGCDHADKGRCKIYLYAH